MEYLDQTVCYFLFQGGDAVNILAKNKLLLTTIALTSLEFCMLEGTQEESRMPKALMPERDARFEQERQGRIAYMLAEDRAWKQFVQLMQKDPDIIKDDFNRAAWDDETETLNEPRLKKHIAERKAFFEKHPNATYQDFIRRRHYSAAKIQKHFEARNKWLTENPGTIPSDYDSSEKVKKWNAKQLQQYLKDREAWLIKNPDKTHRDYDVFREEERIKRIDPTEYASFKSTPWLDALTNQEL